jgi:hypothetical protein
MFNDGCKSGMALATNAWLNSAIYNKLESFSATAVTALWWPASDKTATVKK